jgi:hypothetical protein
MERNSNSSTSSLRAHTLTRLEQQPQQDPYGAQQQQQYGQAPPQQQQYAQQVSALV